MKTPLVLALLFGLLVWRVQMWRADRNRGWVICSQLLSAESRLHLEGEWEITPNGGARLGKGTRLFKHGTVSQSLGAQVFLSPEGAAAVAILGKKLQVSGRFHCVSEEKNFAKREDGISAFRAARWRADPKHIQYQLIHKTDSFTNQIRRYFLNSIESTFENAPGVLGFVKAVWTGGTSGLPPPMLKFYLEGGMLQILALSGQHVNALILLTQLGLNCLAPLLLKSRSFRLWYPYALMLLPSVCSLLLGILSAWTPSVVRTFGMAVSLLILRGNRYSLSFAQLLCSSLAWLLFWDPSLLAAPAFLLSAGATYLLIRLGTQPAGKHRVFEYVLLSLCMPILLLPFTAFFFGKLSVLASVHTLCLGWLWDFILIPFGFLLPLVIFLPLSWRTAVISGVEMTWQCFLKAHEALGSQVSWAYVSVGRPTLCELFVIEVGTVILLLYLARMAKRMLQGGKYAASGFDFYRRKVSNK